MKSKFREIRKGLLDTWMNKKIICRYAKECKDFGSDLCFLCDENNY